MTSKYYPAFLDLSNKEVLVVGAGSVAYRKIASLLKCGARVSAVAPQANAKVRRLANGKKIRLALRKFRTDDLSGKDLAICATDDEALNQTVAESCRKKRIFVNVVDRLALCSFIVPSVIHRGEITFAISTGGASPAMAKFLRRKMEKIFGPGISATVKILKKYRRQIVRMAPQKKKKILAEFLNEKKLMKPGRSLEEKMKRLLA